MFFFKKTAFLDILGFDVIKLKTLNKKQMKILKNKNLIKTLKNRTITPNDLPPFTIAEALKLPQAISDHFAGASVRPLDLAAAINISPTSSNWNYLPGASIAYGLTEGGRNAKEISLTSLGRKIVSPEYEGEDEEGIIEAICRPRILNEFFSKYDNNKMPKDDIMINVLVSMGVPKDKTYKSLEILKANAEFANIFQTIGNNTFVNLKLKKKNIVAHKIETGLYDDPVEIKNITEESKKELPALNSKVFITHGKNKEIVNQLKDLLRFGKFEPIVSIENETISKPVPDKVLDDMRSCYAAIIHVGKETEVLTSEGEKAILLNPNVLIEIGAAMALFGRKFILLTEKGVQLPSNLQGLYEVRYEGEKLDYDATMKLLKAFNDFR
jgi:predicted nucleotide-binding protein